MAINFMTELDDTGFLEDLLDNPEHIKRMNDVNPHGDYSNWKDKASVVKLLNVKWDADKHVVKWDSEDKRDAWFDAQTKDVYEYATNWNHLDLENFAPSLGAYEGDVIVPLPLEQALGYNYIMIDRYQQPVDNSEDSPVRSRFFFFITGVKKSPRSPDATDLIVELDAWTEYTFEGFETMAGDLKRGHWAQDKLTTADYLANPLDSPINLFATEPTLPSVKPKVSYEHLTTPYNDPVIIIASTMDLKNDTGYVDNGNHTPSEEYWWLDFKNDKYKNKFDVDSNLDLDYLASVNPSYTDDNTPFDVDGKTPLGRATRKTINDADQNITSTFYYILELDQWETFIINMRRYYPQIYTTLLAVFILPRSYVMQGEKFDSCIGGLPMQYAHQDNSYHDEYDLKLTPEMFNFKTDYTKLYTSQFSEIEISNLNGERTKLNIEDTDGTLSFIFRANVMFPFLKFEGFVNGAGGSVANTYHLEPLHQQDYQTFMSNWEDLHFEWNIPTYAIYEDAKTSSFRIGQRLQREWAFTNLDYETTLADIDKMHANTFNDIETAYKTGVNSANTTKDNGNASNDTALANALASAQTAKDNATESAENAKTTSNESAETTKDTSLNSINNTKTTSDESNDTSKETGLNSINNAFNIGMRDTNNNKDNAQLGINNTNDVWSAHNDAILQGAALAGGLSALGLATNIAVFVDKDGKIVGIPTGGGGDAVGLSNKAGVTALSAAQLAGQTTINSHEQGQIKDANVKQQTGVMDNNYTTQSNDNTDTKTTNTNNTNLNYATTQQINEQNQATDTANTNQQYNTAILIASQNYTTALDNLTRTYNTSVGNANRSHDTTASNINRSYNNTLTNLGLDRDKGLKNLDNEIKTAKNDALVNFNKRKYNMQLTMNEGLAAEVRAVTQNTGAGSVDAWGRRGIDVRVNRITPADEEIVVNEFKRYGYTMPSNTWIQAPTFAPINPSYGTRHYSYWEFRDIFSWSTKMSETARRVIIEILKQGVTIWDAPENVQTGFLQ